MLAHFVLVVLIDNSHFSDVFDLNDLLPEELIVDPSLVNVSTVIGQGQSVETLRV